MTTAAKSKSVIMTFRVSPDVKEGLEFLSATSDRSSAYLGEVALRQYIEENAWQVKILKERIAEADKGIFISHEAVGKWIKALKKNPKAKMPEPDIFK